MLALDKDGKLVRSAGQLKTGDQIQTRFEKGEALSQVREVLVDTPPDKKRRSSRKKS